METEEFTSESQMEYGEIECSICLGAFEVGDTMRVMKCGHRFHKACVDQWLSNYKAVCPLCKIDLRNTDKSDVEMGDMADADSDTDSAHMSEAEPTAENHHAASSETSSRAVDLE